MTVYGGRGRPAKHDSGSDRTKFVAAISALVVAVLGLLSSPVWGPPICQMVGVCDRPVTTEVSELQSPTPGSTAASPSATAVRPTQPRKTSPGQNSPSPKTTKRPRGTGYPYFAGDYCDEFVRAWQDGYADRAKELSNQQVAALVLAVEPPKHYRNDWGPGGVGAICNILDTDRDNALVIQLIVQGQTTQPGAITEATF